MNSESKINTSGVNSRLVKTTRIINENYLDINAKTTKAVNDE